MDGNDTVNYYLLTVTSPPPGEFLGRPGPGAIVLAGGQGTAVLGYLGVHRLAAMGHQIDVALRDLDGLALRRAVGEARLH